MKANPHWLCVTALLLAPSMVQAQASSTSFTGLAAQAPVSMAQMYEDIEIMRQLMSQAIHDRWGSLYPQGSGASLYAPGDMYPNLNVGGFGLVGGSGMLGGGSGILGGGIANSNIIGMGMNTLHPYGTIFRPAPSEASTRLAIEGMHLKGRGAVFSVILPPPSRSPRPGDVKPAPKPPDQWDRVRKQLRGEQAKAAPTAAAGQNPTVGDVLLKVLADNGHHFSQLAEGESLTLVVTFRSNEAPSSRRPAKAGHKKKGAAADPNSSPARNDDLLLGDLHLKQGKAKEALKIYLAVVKNHPDILGPDLMRKLAQAHLAAGDLKEARKWLDRALEKSATPDTPREQAQTAEPLPSRLLITASKRLLDQVAAGAITFADFQRSVSIEEVPGPAKK
jgi:hypothetical protein